VFDLPTSSSGAVEFPIGGTLDLHTFRPEDVKDLVPDYIQECRSRGILEVKIVHGKGTGTLMRIVHSILDQLPEVVDYSCGGNT
jgi:dsDNA-specific endonuclease/ATPase MutS2